MANPDEGVKSIDIEVENEAKKFLYLKDAVGRWFKFPFELVESWENMKDMINQAFRMVDVLQAKVEAGHYDLLVDDHIILPRVWDQLVKPGWRVTMKMWRMNKFSNGDTIQPPLIPPPIPRPPLRQFGLSPPNRPNITSSASSDSQSTVLSRPHWADASEYVPPGEKRQRGVDDRSRALELGLTVVPRRVGQVRRIRRHVTFPLVEKNPSPVVKHSIISAYCFKSEMNSGDVSLELTKRGQVNISSGGPPTNSKDLLKWINVSRDYMDLDEFESIALDQDHFNLDGDHALAVENVIKTVRDQKLERSCDSYRVKPGTATRCDVTSTSKIVSSAIFVSVPYLEVGSFHRSFQHKLRKGVCVPLRLHEFFNPYDTSYEQDKNQVFRRYHGAKSNEVLWLRETWVLIVDSVGILTYGGQSPEAYLGDNIDIRDEQPHRLEQERLIQVEYREKEFRIPLDDCKAYFELQSYIRAILNSVSKTSLPDLQLEFSNGEPITATNWSNAVETLKDTIIRVSVHQILPEVGAIGDNKRRPLAPFDWTLDMDTPKKMKGSRKKKMGLPASDRPRKAAISTPDRDFVVFKRPFNTDSKGMLAYLTFLWLLSCATNLRSSEPDFCVPELDPIAPPFLAWGIIKDEHRPDRKDVALPTRTEEDLQASVVACLIKVATALDNAENPHVSTLYNTFPDLNSNPDALAVNVGELEKRLTELQEEGKLKGQDDVEYMSLYGDFIHASRRALEAFAPKASASVVLTRCYKALYRGLETHQKREAAKDPSSYYVILPESLPNSPEVRRASDQSDELDCEYCVRYEIYHTMGEAVDHLEQKHNIESAPRSHVTGLPTATKTKLNKERCKLLRTCRKTLAEIIEYSKQVQGGTVFNRQFQNPVHGVPYAMLEAMQVLVSYICIVPLILDEIDWFYKLAVYEDVVTSLALGENIIERQALLDSTGNVVQTLMKNAERALISSLRSTKKEDAVNFFQSVGTQCIALQMIGNLVRSPIHDGKGSAQLFHEYVSQERTQALCQPSKRLLPSLGALLEDLIRLQNLSSWQSRGVASVRVFLSPESYSDPSKNRRAKAFDTEDFILDNIEDWLQGESDSMTSSMDRCNGLVDHIRHILEVLQDDNSRVIFIFAVVTTVFLPLSFVATYLSMNGGPSQRDWGRTQATFWEVSAPLAAGITIFCLVVSWHNPVRDWLVGLMQGTKRDKVPQGVQGAHKV